MFGLRKGAIRNLIIEAAEKKPPDGRGGEGGLSVDTSQGLITPEWVTRVKVSDDQRPETPSDLEFLTEDVSKVYPRAVNLFFFFYFYPLDLGIESQGVIVQL